MKTIKKTMITQEDINRQLFLARMCAQRHYKWGNKRLGDNILATSSKMALLSLRLVEKRLKPIRCHLCNKRLTLGLEVEFYKNVNACYTCDKSINNL